MKPFNLKEALEGKPVVTRNGHKITSIHYFENLRSSHPVYAHIELTVRVEKFNVEGKWTTSGSLEHDLDLFMADEERWVNVYWDASKRCVCSLVLWETEEKAKNAIDKNDNDYLATLRVKL